MKVISNRQKAISISILFFLFSFLSLISYLLSPGAASAATPSAALSQEQIEKLKKDVEKIVSKNPSEKRGLIGTVTDASTTQITIEDTRGNARFIDVDDLTKFAAPGKTSFGISDITKGVTLGILGLYNKESRRILSRFVNVISLPKFFHGQVASIDGENYTIAIKTSDSKFNVGVETTTKTLSYAKGNGLIRAGFSKIKEEQSIIVVGFPDTKDEKSITASRIIIFPDIATNPNLSTSPTADNQVLVPSTGSGKKLTPIVK